MKTKDRVEIAKKLLKVASKLVIGYDKNIGKWTPDKDVLEQLAIKLQDVATKTMKLRPLVLSVGGWGPNKSAVSVKDILSELQEESAISLHFVPKKGGPLASLGRLMKDTYSCAIAVYTYKDGFRAYITPTVNVHAKGFEHRQSKEDSYINEKNFLLQPNELDKLDMVPDYVAKYYDVALKRSKK